MDEDTSIIDHTITENSKDLTLQFTGQYQKSHLTSVNQAISHLTSFNPNLSQEQLSIHQINEGVTYTSNGFGRLEPASNQILKNKVIQMRQGVQQQQMSMSQNFKKRATQQQMLIPQKQIIFNQVSNSGKSRNQIQYQQPMILNSFNHPNNRPKTNQPVPI